MELLVQKADFKNITQIAHHCDYEALEQYILERQNLDLVQLLGNCFYVDIIENKDTNEYQDVLNGSTFELTCGSKTKTLIHFGLKRILIHYAYAAYIYRHGIKDTPFGVVLKQSQDSVPVPTHELKIIHDENRKMAYSYWKMTLQYLCANKEQFPNFDTSLCKGCMCGSCNGGKTDTTRKKRITIIKKDG